MCWWVISPAYADSAHLLPSRYADSLDDDWIIGFHPSDPAVIVSTGGSGHAYKAHYANTPHLSSLTDLF